MEPNKNQYFTSQVISTDDDYVYISFPNKKLYKIPIGNFDDQDITNIKLNNYCNGCLVIDPKGYNGTKYSWCRLSRNIANYITK